jgi:hypothetical protein
MSVSATIVNQVNILKRLWGSGVSDPMYKASRFLGAIKKDTKFGGEGRYVIVDISPTAGGSSSFSEALANQDATTTERFFVTHRKEYQVFSIQGDLIARSQGDKNAVVEGLKHQTEKARYAHARAMAHRAWGHGGGALGVISAGSNVATATITLATPSNIVAFEKGMWLQASDDAGNAASPAGTLDGGRKVQIGAVDRETGSLTLASGLWNQIAGIATGDFLFRAGDYGAAMTGAQGWAPQTAPSAGESFFGVDRTTKDVVRTSGIRVGGNGQPKLQTLLDMTAQAQVNGAMYEGAQCYVNPLDFRDIAKERESARVIEGKSRDGRVGFKSLEVIGNSGAFNVVSETDVPQGFAWLLNVDEIYLRTAGDCPRNLNWDTGRMFLPAHDDDALQGRLGCYGNIFFENPGEAVIGTF